MGHGQQKRIQTLLDGCLRRIQQMLRDEGRGPSLLEPKLSGQTSTLSRSLRDRFSPSLRSLGTRDPRTVGGLPCSGAHLAAAEGDPARQLLQHRALVLHRGLLGCKAQPHRSSALGFDDLRCGCAAGASDAQLPDPVKQEDDAIYVLLVHVSAWDAHQDDSRAAAGALIRPTAERLCCNAFQPFKRASIVLPPCLAKRSMHTCVYRRSWIGRPTNGAKRCAHLMTSC